MIRFLMILMLFTAGCSNDNSPLAKTTDMAEFAMECKKLAKNLKADFIVAGQSNSPTCVVGLPDKVYGGLDGASLPSMEYVRGANEALELQRRLPFHDKIQGCYRMCSGFRIGEGVACREHCFKKIGYKK